MPAQHLSPAYLNEFSFRYNLRLDTKPMFVSLLKQVEKRDVMAYRAPVAVKVEPF
jgi:hypothetical protein